VIVRDLGDAWQIVLQPDHAVLSAQFAERWGNDRFDRPRPHASVVTATLRHDDGWAVWERAPAILDGDAGPRPRNFLDVDVGAHLAFYRAMIASVREQDDYAGLLVSMHGSGIYTGRYDTNPELKLTFAAQEQAQVDAFVAEQEDAQAAAVARLGVPDDERWVNYKLLQVYDRLSLYFCMRDLERGEGASLAPVPLRYGGGETELALEPAGPWSVRLAPYPFADGQSEFTLVRRVLPKRAWADGDAFRREFFATPPETTRIAIAAG
jgi:hypothetical protein